MKKNVETENKNEVMNNEQVSVETSQVTNEELEQFVKDNDNWVPKNQRKKFDAMTLNQKAAKIKFWQDMQKMRDEYIEKHKIENKVIELLSRRKATVEDVLKVIDTCKAYINDCKAQELAKLDEEIARLNAMRSQIENN